MLSLKFPLLESVPRMGQLYIVFKIWYNIIALVRGNVTRREYTHIIISRNVGKGGMFMKNAKKLFNGWFWSWLGLTVLLVVAMMIVGKQPHTSNMAAVIMATFMLLPVRDWMYRGIVWAIDYVASIKTGFRKRIYPHTTYTTMGNQKDHVVNPGFYRTLKVIVGVICLVLALLWLVFKGTSFNVVYAWLHTIEFLFRGRISWLALLIYVLLTIAFLYMVYWAVGQILNGELYNGTTGRIDWKKAWWKILIMVLGFYAKIIISGMLLSFTAMMIVASVRFWTIVVGFPILIFEIWIFIQRHRTPPTP